jgi:hypothetical protein
MVALGVCWVCIGAVLVGEILCLGTVNGYLRGVSCALLAFWYRR